VTDDIAANKGLATRLVAELAGPVFLVVLVVVALVGGIFVGVLAAVVVAGALAAYLWRAGSGTASRALGGRPADPARDARLVNLVEGLGAANGVPVPSVLVIDDPAPNALSFGLDARHATIGVTTGLLARLSRVELEGVVAREIARIKSHATRPETVAVAVLTIVGPIRPWADHVRALAVGKGGLAVADAEGVRLTRYPPGLANALEHLGPDAAGVRAGSSATAHLWLEPPVRGVALDVHPPLEERVEALREL
jgi:heat shock protein HtpX